MKKLLFLLFLSAVLYGQQPAVVVITLDAAITPAAAEFIAHGIELGKTRNASCVIIRLNTPGGLLKSTRAIVTSLLESPIPVVVYVSPAGAQAASAGVFITMAANIAAMAPGTNIGAAHPVSMQGQMDSVMSGKVTNDAAAFIRSISEKRNRNIRWAEAAVRNSLSLTEKEALDSNVVDIIAKDIPALLAQLNGRQVETAAGTVTLTTLNATVTEEEMNFAFRLLTLLSDPNIAYLLFLLGLFGLLFELYNPGAIFPGVIGGIALIISLYTLNTLPVNYAGLALIVLAVVLFVLELKIVSHGVLGAGAVVSLLLGSVMLFNSSGGLESVRVSWSIIISAVVFTTLFFIFAIGAGIKAQKRPTATGVGGLIGAAATVLAPCAPQGTVRVHGEIWNAVSASGNLQVGEQVTVTAVTGLTVTVSKSV